MKTSFEDGVLKAEKKQVKQMFTHTLQMLQMFSVQCVGQMKKVFAVKRANHMFYC